jgi:hypothetical protein
VPTYVSSLRGNARVTHIGNMYGTACGQVLAGPFDVTNEQPADRPLCATCAAGNSRARAAAALTTGTVTIHEAMRKIDRQVIERERDALVVELLREGLDNLGVARRLQIASRTAVRYINDGQRRAGAKTRFDWGYRRGYADGQASVAS